MSASFCPRVDAFQRAVTRVLRCALKFRRMLDALAGSLRPSTCGSVVGGLERPFAAFFASSSASSSAAFRAHEHQQNAGIRVLGWPVLGSVREKDTQ